MAQHCSNCGLQIGNGLIKDCGVTTGTIGAPASTVQSCPSSTNKKHNFKVSRYKNNRGRGRGRGRGYRGRGHRGRGYRGRGRRRGRGYRGRGQGRGRRGRGRGYRGKSRGRGRGNRRKNKVTHSAQPATAPKPIKIEITDTELNILKSININGLKQVRCYDTRVQLMWNKPKIWSVITETIKKINDNIEYDESFLKLYLGMDIFSNNNHVNRLQFASQPDPFRYYVHQNILKSKDNATSCEEKLDDNNMQFFMLIDISTGIKQNVTVRLMLQCHDVHNKLQEPFQAIKLVESDEITVIPKVNCGKCRGSKYISVKKERNTTKCCGQCGGNRQICNPKGTTTQCLSCYGGGGFNNGGTLRLIGGKWVCPSCEGKGFDYQPTWKPCTACTTGYVPAVEEYWSQEICVECKGIGKMCGMKNNGCCSNVFQTINNQ